MYVFTQTPMQDSLVSPPPPMSLQDLMENDLGSLSVSPPTFMDLDEPHSDDCSGSEAHSDDCFELEAHSHIDDHHCIKKRGVVTKHGKTVPKQQHPPIGSLERNTKPNHKKEGTGRRAMTAAKADAATIAAKVQATEAAAQVTNDWITSATLTRNTPRNGGAAGESPGKKPAAKLLKEGRIQKARQLTE